MAAKHQKRKQKPPRTDQQGADTAPPEDTRSEPAVPDSTATFAVDMRRLTRYLLIGCLVVELLFVWLDFYVNSSYASESGPVRRLFNITREDALPSWFSVTLTFLVALTSAAIFWVQRAAGASRATRWGWILLTFFFLYMAADDGAKIHERMGSAYKEAHEAGATEAILTRGASDGLLDRFPSYPWQVLFVPVFGTAGLLMMVFLWRQFQKPGQRMTMIVAIALLALAVGIDFIEGLDENHRWNLYTHIVNHWDIKLYSLTTFRRPPYDAVRHFSKSLEEFIEMFAMTLLWVTLLRHLASRAPALRISFTDRAKPSV